MTSIHKTFVRYSGMVASKTLSLSRARREYPNPKTLHMFPYHCDENDGTFHDTIVSKILSIVCSANPSFSIWSSINQLVKRVPIRYSTYGFVIVPTGLSHRFSPGDINVGVDIGLYQTRMTIYDDQNPGLLRYSMHRAAKAISEKEQYVGVQVVYSNDDTIRVFKTTFENLMNTIKDKDLVNSRLVSRDFIHTEANTFRAIACSYERIDTGSSWSVLLDTIKQQS